MANYIVYRFINKLTGESYIGKTTRSLAKRRSDHVYKAKNGYTDKFHQAILHYGIDNFDAEILHVCKNKKQLALCEINLIRKYNTIDNGYNTQVRK